MILSADALVAPAVDGPGWLQTEGDRIVALGSGVVAADAHFPVLVPGFVDVHVHGGAGAAFPGGDVEDALRAVAFHRAHGTTTTLASLVTAAPEELRRAVDALAELVVDGEIAGVHLEGPWLAASRCGAHDPAQLRDPDPGELDELLVTGVVAMVTLAPERVGALDAVRRVVGAGAVAAVGHTDADFALTRAAIAAGARHATHLFNAMAPLHHREPGPVVALLDDDRVTVELVTDGLHVHPALWEHVVRAAGAHRVAAVTDAMAAAGMPDGAYRLGATRRRGRRPRGPARGRRWARGDRGQHRHRRRALPQHRGARRRAADRRAAPGGGDDRVHARPRAGPARRGRARGRAPRRPRGPLRGPGRRGGLPVGGAGTPVA